MITYYNIQDEITENYPKGMPRNFFKNEKFFIDDKNERVDNPNFNEIEQYNLLLDREKQIKLKELKEKILKKLIEQDSEFQTEKEKIEKTTELNALKNIKFNN